MNAYYVYNLFYYNTFSIIENCKLNNLKINNRRTPTPYLYDILNYNIPSICNRKIV